MNFNDVAIVSVNGSDYRNHMSKNDAKEYNEKFKLKWTKWVIIIFLSSIKMSEETYYQKHRNVILKKAKDYYKNYKERLKDNARDK